VKDVANVASLGLFTLRQFTNQLHLGLDQPGLFIYFTKERRLNQLTRLHRARRNLNTGFGKITMPKDRQLIAAIEAALVSLW